MSLAITQIHPRWDWSFCSRGWKHDSLNKKLLKFSIHLSGGISTCSSQPKRRFNGFQPQKQCLRIWRLRESFFPPLRKKSHKKCLTRVNYINDDHKSWKIVWKYARKNKMMFCSLVPHPPRLLYTWLDFHKNILPVIFLSIEWCCDFLPLSPSARWQFSIFPFYEQFGKIEHLRCNFLIKAKR